jgi:hypothetical protein
MEENILRKHIRKIIKEQYSFNEFIDFKKIGSKIGSLFSSKPKPQTSVPVEDKKLRRTRKTDIQSVDRNEFRKYNNINIGNNLVPIEKISPLFLESIFEKVEGKIERKKIQSIQWLFDKKASFDVEKIEVSSNFDPENINPKHILFSGVWKSGVFKGTFFSGIFEGGFIDGGIYRAKSLNFLPGKKISDKLNAFKKGAWLSLDGLFGLKYVTPPGVSNSYNILEIAEDNFINLTLLGKEKMIIKIEKQPFGNDLSFKYNVKKYDKSNNLILEDNYEGDLNDIKNNLSEYNISFGKNKKLFFGDNVHIKFIKLEKKK